MNTHQPHPGQNQKQNTARRNTPRGGRGLLLASPNFPGRARPRLLGDTSDQDGPLERVGLAVADARYHAEILGRTGVGKTTAIANLVIGEARAGRGVALIDCQGDAANNVLERLPSWCGDRLVILDPAETTAPPAYNPLAAPTSATGDSAQGRDGDGRGDGAEWAAEHLVATIRQLNAAWWGPRMDDLLRAAALTLARRPDSTIADVLAILTDTAFRRSVLARYGSAAGLGTLWDSFEAMTPNARDALCAPLVVRLRSVLSRRFARELLGAPHSTFDLAEILDGGILIARLPKGEIGADTARLVSGLVLAGLWAAATRRSRIAPDARLDASIFLDEAQNALALPIDLDLALAESRGYRVSWWLAHQHDEQVPPLVRWAIDANARNKIYFSLAPRDAPHKVHHVRPYFTEHDLCQRPAYEMTVRLVDRGQDQPPFTLRAFPLPPPIPGRARWLRARARHRTGLPHTQRAEQARRREARERAHNSPLHDAGYTAGHAAETDNQP